MKKGFIRNALILFAITLVSGLLLSMVYEITKEPIKKAEEDAKNKAYQTVLKADNYVVPEKASSLIEKANADFESGKNDANGIKYKRVLINEALEAKDKDNKTLGYIVTVTSKNGYGGDIQVTFGIGSDFTITGFEVLSQNETAGFGAKCVEDSYKSSFKGKKNATDVDTITGATFTSTAIKQTVGAGLCFITNYLDKEGY